MRPRAGEKRISFGRVLNQVLGRDANAEYVPKERVDIDVQVEGDLSPLDTLMATALKEDEEKERSCRHCGKADPDARGLRTHERKCRKLWQRYSNKGNVR